MDEKIIARDGTEFENEDAAKAAGYGQCDDCGAWVHYSDLSSTVDNDLVCGDCRDDHYATCYYCGELFDMNRGGLEVEGHPYCDEECAERDGNFYCRNCEEWHPQRDYAGDLRDDSDYPLCNWCVTNCDFGTCADCGTIYPYDELYTNDYGDSYCEDCDRRREEDDAPGEHTCPLY